MGAIETIDETLTARSQTLVDALEQQAATAEILRVISRSPADTQPVFDTIAAAALRLCAARSANVFTYDGSLLQIAALAIVDPQGIEAMRSIFPRPASRDSAACRAVLSRDVVAIADVLADPDFVTRHAAVAAGFRSSLAVPLMRDGQPIGAIAVGRAEAGPFPTSQIALLQTFAEQATIAIENVRLFNEREARNRELLEALEQQTATSEILRVISKSPTDVQPVFDTIVVNAARLCEANFAFLMLHDGGRLSLAARTACTPAFAEYLARGFPVDGETTTGRAALERKPVQVEDFMADAGLRVTAAHRSEGVRTVLAVPLLRDQRLLGVTAIWRHEVRPFTAKQTALLQTFADQAVIAIENVRLFNETQEALAHQTATSDVLQVISGSMADARPVFEKILDRCEQLFGATDLGVFLVDGQERLNVGAYRGSFADWAPGTYPRPLAGTMSEVAISRNSLMHWADVEQAQDIPDYIRDVVRQGGNFAVAVAPLVWEGRGIGTIDVMRKPPRAYSQNELALLATFADQAVIAIQNARLFNETRDALARQTATSDVLRVISGSVTDTQPVFDVIAERASRLTGANSGWVFLFDGEWIHSASSFGLSPQALALALTFFPMRPSRQSYTAQAIRDGAVVNVADALAETDPEYATKPVARAAGYRSVLSVPMLRGRQVIGAISVNRAEVGRFADKEVELLQTFADQAVIAIENARLFKELEARNRDLTEALEWQTTTSEILRVISRSPTDAQPVFDTIASATQRLCRASVVNVLRYDGQLLHLGALTTLDAEGAAAARRLFPRPPGPGTAAGMAVLTRGVFAVPDVLADPDYAFRAGAQWGVRGVLGIPLMREGTPIGALVICRPEPGPFPERQIGLLQTFADQAVIAIENVRLFNELQARTTELTRSVEQLRALSEVGQAVGSTLDLATVLRTIVSRAIELAGMDGGAIYEYDAADETFALHTAHRLPTPLVEALAATPMTKGDGAIGRLASTREPVAVPDILDTGVYQSRVRDLLVELGYRSLLAVPLLNEDRLLGGLVVNRRQAGAFEPRVVELLQTFATQSALAIQNARLFREVEDKSRQLEIASRHKSAFLANMSHELRTPLNAIIGFTRIVMRRTREQIDAKQVQNLENILASAQHLLSLINAALDLAKVEAGRVEVNASEVDLAPLLDDCVRTVEPLLGEQVQLVVHRGSGLPSMLVDEEKLRQIVINLLSNAVKFTARGRINVTTRCVDGRVEIAVADTGIGIPADKLEAVFEEFEQVDASSTRAHGGTGLGLAIARRLARLMGGDLRAETVLGQGSTFTLRLPLRFERTIA